MTFSAESGIANQTEGPVFLTGAIDELAGRIDALAGRGRLFRISDSHVDALYGDRLDEALRATGRWVKSSSFPAGEQNKNIQTVERLWAFLLEHEVERQDVILAFGGGVTGDLAGFAAATTLRGIRAIQAPTTVLAMCDAAIGGKTGFNLGGKNLVGAFHLPTAVLAWTPSLDTLPVRERNSGLAEVVKSALIQGEADLAALEKSAADLSAGEPRALARAIERAARTKQHIVAQDLHEAGLRKLLNLGHTFGHAIETASGYGKITHGEAVSIGLVLAARYAASSGHCSLALVERITTLLQRLSLPVEAPHLSVDDWERHLRRDKKKIQNELNLILPREAGDIFVQAVHPANLAEWLANGAPIAVSPDAVRA